MIKQLTTVNVWVGDQEEALAFYTGKLGFEVLEDVTVAELGNFRWLTVAVPGQNVGLALMKVPPAPIFTDETRDQIHALLAKGAMGGLFFAVDDCRATHAELAARGVEFTQTPSEQPYGIDAGFRDPWGNQFRMIERHPMPA